MSDLSSLKIDTHHHFLPSVYADAVGLEALAAVMPNGKAPDWSVDSALSMMEAQGIGRAILSISSGPALPDAPVLVVRHGVVGGTRLPGGAVQDRASVPDPFRNRFPDGSAFRRRPFHRRDRQIRDDEGLRAAIQRENAVALFA